ncbi:MAG TPA: hypothetical protein VEL72_01230 [Ktedonobacteraceae bacterium]|nr:hypothetical protein [Ktedonobacteraceae bacterium]
MLIRIPQMILRVCGLIALLLGITFWINLPDDALIPIHMLLGILVVLSLWMLGIIMATARGGNIALGVGAIIWGALVLSLGLTQTRLLIDPSVHWIIQVLHLLLGMGAIALGETIARRYRGSKLAPMIM